MSTKAREKIEFGDFQTPYSLCRRICKVIDSLELSPRCVVEPTCGVGSFLRASTDIFPDVELSLGFEINADYVQIASTVKSAKVYCDDFFKKDWPKTLDNLPEPILVIGNPPWVTNSSMGVLNGTNLPTKSNFQNLNGFDAITGKSNFDISEWMLLHLLKWLSGRVSVLSMLCKTSVARKVLQQAWTEKLHIKKSAIYSINADRHFGASVDACLLVCILVPGEKSQKCAIYSDLNSPKPKTEIALHNGQLVSDLQAISTCSHLYGKSPFKWRSGIKHDCSRVMELWPTEEGGFKNGYGELESLETTFLYPMLKSSELMKSNPTPSRYMLVTQRSVGEDTSWIETEAPRTWRYLEMHANSLDQRSSSIYRNRPKFSIFGVGPYSFSPWKVAISGFYKKLHFSCIGPIDAKPIVLDDTCYFIPCQSQKDAQTLLGLLNSKLARNFFDAFVFWNAKRPITAQLLGNLDLGMLAKELGVSLPACIE